MRAEQNGYLHAIHSPDDLKRLPSGSLPFLAKEIRERIIHVVQKNGGHLASNLGVVELTIALHRVFSTPKDKIIWDVGHQCYTHKLLTGREDRFDTIRKKDGLSGFPKRSESIHDAMDTGHSSTSISAGLGILTGMRLSGDSEGKVVAVIGDGAMTGGMAFEALNHAGDLAKDLIVVFNDNNWSISPNVGGLSVNSNLSKLSASVSKLTTTRFYQSLRKYIDRGLRGIPFLGYKLYELFIRFKKALKAVVFKETIFSELGFEYVGPIDGHSISRLTEVFEAVRHLHKPVIVHVITQKGRGHSLAEVNPTAYHGVSPMVAVDGKIERKSVMTFTEVFAESLMREAEQRSEIVAITAAMCEGTGLSSFRESYPDRFFDVGISEQHAVTFAAGLAASGMRPVVAIYSTFMQRAVDQVIHDVALPSLPVLFCLDRSGLVGADGETHQGLYDLSLFLSVPGMTLLAPAGKEELPLMLAYALTLDGPCMIRYPKDACLPLGEACSRPIEKGRGVFLREEGGDVLILSYGASCAQCVGAADLLEREGVGADVCNIRFAKPIDEEWLLDSCASYRTLIIVEEASSIGGIGEYLIALISRYHADIDLFHFGVPDRFLPHASRRELLSSVALDAEAIAGRVRLCLAERETFGSKSESWGYQGKE
ncbi:1-deoxy-D-xylulose-5-phosphate synthase [Sediminispirochaeta bajacaliforniensis]|uniref:1-deoxy-D-xylulose-5-phosphate synthase n=1 Tax=Sediminispirochaeta bajacaliforniensis TaxID=148 RepID=UPI00037380C3|nr:1-deoxy-D-xylulose-5-phosphate synthase [Sediminispirochaeta bajacaliforniensis]